MLSQMGLNTSPQAIDEHIHEVGIKHFMLSLSSPNLELPMFFFNNAEM